MPASYGRSVSDTTRNATFWSSRGCTPVMYTAGPLDQGQVARRVHGGGARTGVENRRVWRWVFPSTGADLVVGQRLRCGRQPAVAIVQTFDAQRW